MKLDGDLPAGLNSGTLSGVHRRAVQSRVLVIEPDKSARSRWGTIDERYRVEFVTGAATLSWALKAPGPPKAVSVALAERTSLRARTKLLRKLEAVVRQRALRVVIDVRRCDLTNGLALSRAGYVLCADDEIHRGSATRAAMDHSTMADQLEDRTARHRLIKTLGATHISDRHGLTAAEHRVLRGLMDHTGSEALGLNAGLAPSTVRSHTLRMRRKIGANAISDVVRAAEEAGYDAAYAFGCCHRR